MVIGVVCGGNLLVLMAMNLDDSGVGRGDISMVFVAVTSGGKYSGVRDCNVS